MGNSEKITKKDIEDLINSMNESVKRQDKRSDFINRLKAYNRKNKIH